MPNLTIMYDRTNATNAPSGLLKCIFIYGTKTFSLLLNSEDLKKFFDSGVPILNNKKQIYTKFNEIFKLN